MGTVIRPEARAEAVETMLVLGENEMIVATATETGIAIATVRETVIGYAPVIADDQDHQTIVVDIAAEMLAM